MPPVRWKGWFYVMAILVQAAFVTDAQQMQDSISMSSDGWRPIVGSRRQPPNPNYGVEVIQADVLNIETTTLPLPQSFLSAQKAPVKAVKEGVKLKHSFKATSPYFTMSPGSPITIRTNEKLKKLQGVKKSTMVYGKPRKPVRGQALAHSSRNEIFVPPPQANSGSYSFVKSISPSSIKTREAQGFGLLGGSNFGLSQPNAHIELSRYPLTGETILQRPTFLFAKPMQNDEFTRNLVPPPFARLQQQNQDNTHKISLYAFKEGPIADATSSFPQFGGKPNQFVPQVSSSFDFSSQPQQQTSQKTKEQAVDVQVTKENLKQFTQNAPGTFAQNGPGTFTQNGPGPLTQNRPGTFTQNGPGTFGSIRGRNNFPIEYVDYDFHAPKPRPSNLPNTLTYEVTEGKWLDTPSQQYQFRPQDTFIPQRPQLQNHARPGLLFQSDVSSSRPSFFQAPLVELNVPAFLPTPYKPENSVIPTSPTQSEVSTVFNQLSKKMNKFRNNALRNNPLFFDITEVSTHYPILGTPEAQSEGATDIPLSINENGEISNEITTQKEHKQRTRRPTKGPTESTSSRDPTKSRISNRKRPRPRKPSTTTTEETVIDKYEAVKSQENVQEAPVETERPQRRRRPKPSLYRPKQTNAEDAAELTDNKKSVEDDSSSKQRGRYRFRNRERPSTERSDTGIIEHTRSKPTENIYIEQQKQSLDESTESSMEHKQYSYESDPTVDSSYSEEMSQLQPTGAKELSTQNQSPGRYTQDEQPIRQDNRPFIEEVHSVTEKNTVYERTRVPLITTTEAESSTLFHVPENEIDYTTQAPVPEEEPNDDIISTTPQTTTAPEVTTTKSSRIRRPSKYDSSSRPRFSVKDYRQRLNQYTSSTPSATTQMLQKNSTDNLRLRFPGRLRTRPSPTTATSRVDEDFTDETTTTMRSRFHPKEPRHQTTTESEFVITEKSVKAVNTRLRPFGRSRATTEATTSAPKISIRPNLFSARRRAGYPSLKNRIQNKYKKNETEDGEEAEVTTLQSELEEIESLRITESVTTESTATTTGFNLNQLTTDEVSTEFSEQTTTEDIMKIDDLLYSQRVSDLTSSFKDYDKPGAFNSVSPTSRSIPNYFTISTDDPILPIEAFFPNLKDKEKAKKR